MRTAAARGSGPGNLAKQGRVWRCSKQRQSSSSWPRSQLRLLMALGAAWHSYRSRRRAATALPKSIFFAQLRRRLGLLQNVDRGFCVQLGGETVLLVRHVPDDRMGAVVPDPLCHIFWQHNAAASQCPDTRATSSAVLHQGVQNIFASRNDAIKRLHLATFQEAKHLLSCLRLHLLLFGRQRRRPLVLFAGSHQIQSTVAA